MPEENHGPQPRAPEQLLAAQNLVLEMIALGNPLEDVLRALASFIDLLEPAGMSCIFLLEPDERTFRLAVASKLPESFAGWVGGQPIAGACGAAVSRRERVIVPDVETDPLYREFPWITHEYGVRSCWATPILSSEGAAFGAVAIYYDRTHTPGEHEIRLVERATGLARIAIERRRFEAHLHRFRALIESTSDVIAILDLNRIIRYVSPSAERVLGYTPGELVGTPWFDLLHPEDRPVGELGFTRALEKPGVVASVERRLRRKDGVWRIIEIIGNNQVSDPAIAGLIINCRDVTDRKAAEEELIASQDSYRELFQNANDIVYTHDLAGKLTSLNRAGEALTGYTSLEALGIRIAQLIAPEYSAIPREMMDRMLGGEPKTTYELEILSKQGARILVEMSTRLVFQNGRPVAVQGIARDVTERRQFESHLLQSQKMEAIGRLAGGVAHDFNNLLTVITGYSQWITDEIPAGSPLSECASEILAAAARASALTNQLMAFSRNQIIQPIILDLNSLVAQLEQMLRRVIGEDIELETRTGPNLAVIRADPSQVEQVILNLVVNARDAMPGGGKLTIETANARIGHEFPRGLPDSLPGDYVMLAVSDSGCGIDPQMKPHIFEPFFTTKEVGKGTGLGLSTVYGIVTQGGGHIRVESAPGEGSRFRVYFPQVAGSPAPSAAPQRLVARGGSETILLVEDEAAVRRMAKEILARLGYKLVEASDPRSAQKLIAEYDQPIHLLLTDVVMPQMSGRELARQVTELRAGMKVMFMSGYAHESILQEGLLQPGSVFLRKPFTPDALAVKVREALDGAP